MTSAGVHLCQTVSSQLYQRHLSLSLSLSLSLALFVNESSLDVNDAKPCQLSVADNSLPSSVPVYVVIQSASVYDVVTRGCVSFAPLGGLPVCFCGE